jgi:HAD superfamily hydrolase (TIGR01450 family)
VIFDLDGVVYVGSEAVPRAPENIRTTVDSGTAVAYVTNNASRRGTEVAALLRELGVPAKDDEVITSAQAAAELMAEHLPAGAPVLVVGAEALRDELRSVGLTPVAGVADKPAAVVQGYGREVGWADLAEGCLAVRAGAWWVATNTDATMPSARGPVPGNGSMVAALATALGRRPDLVVGKPEPALFEVAAGRRGASRALVVGDRLDTDIEGAVRAGMDSLLVLTGVSGAADVLRAGVQERPTFIAADLRALSTTEGQVRVPEWDGTAATAGVWRVTLDAGRLVLAEPDTDTDSGNIDALKVDALRALAAAAWAQSEPVDVEPGGPTASNVLRELGLQAQ